MIFSPLESGLSVESNPISAYKSDVKASSYLYLLAGTHGDEVEGVYVLQQYFEWLSKEHSLSDLPIIVIPILNVDGYRSGTRVNAHGIDLNRNYPCSTWIKETIKDKNNPGEKPGSEPENQFLLKLFDKYHPGLVLSFHSWKPILNFNGKCEDIAQFLHQYNKYPVEGDIGYPTPGSLGTFVPEKYDCPVLTFECPLLSSGKTLKEIWMENEEGLKELIKNDLLTQKLSLSN